ncbi:MAG: hypothetical protein ACFFDC_01530 [Promethearchaeota archaeon]
MILRARTILGICGIISLLIWVIPLRFWPLDLWPSPNEFKINRYSNQTEGITPILHLEGFNVLEKARGISSEDNEFINLSYQGDGLNPNCKIYHVINKTVIDYYNTQEDGKGLYLAYSWSIENQNFSNSMISAVLEDINLVDKYLYNRLDHYRYDG